MVRGHATVGRLSNNVFGRFVQSGSILKKVTERSRDSGWRSLDRRPTVKQRLGRFKQLGFFVISHWMVTRQWSEVTRPYVGRLSNNVFGRLKQLGKFLWKVTERSRDSGRRSRDRRPTVKQRIWTFQATRINFDKVTERSRDSGRRSRDRCPTVKQLLFDVSSKSETFWKKSFERSRNSCGRFTRPAADCQALSVYCCYLTGRILHQCAWNSVA